MTGLAQAAARIKPIGIVANCFRAQLFEWPNLFLVDCNITLWMRATGLMQHLSTLGSYLRFLVNLAAWAADLPSSQESDTRRIL